MGGLEDVAWWEEVAGGPLLIGELVGDVGFGLDFDAPSGVDEGRDDNHGGGGTGDGKELSVDASDLFPIFDAGEVDAGADNVLDGRSGLLEGGGDDGEGLFGLGCGIGVFGVNGAGAGDVDVGADADGAREADDGLVGTRAGEVLAGRHEGLDAVVSGLG